MAFKKDFDLTGNGVAIIANAIHEISFGKIIPKRDLWKTIPATYDGNGLELTPEIKTKLPTQWVEIYDINIRDIDGGNVLRGIENAIELEIDLNEIPTVNKIRDIYQKIAAKYPYYSDAEIV